MTTYFIGDVQGCYEPLMRLLEKIQYNPSNDVLSFCGDLVNRGPQSLQVLQFVLDQPHAQMVLGNHDIYALYYLLGGKEIGQKHTLGELLHAPIKDKLIELLLKTDLMIHQPGAYAMVHAGIVPQWTVAEAYDYSKLWREAVDNNDPLEVITLIWGNQPCDSEYSDDPWMRLRYVVNVLTRLRFCDAKGTLDFHSKMATCPLADYKPWFEWRAANTEEPIIFGHWAALEGVERAGFIGLDTGCAWGGSLTAYAFEDKQYFSVTAQ